jgi:hypothetical protein
MNRPFTFTFTFTFAFAFAFASCAHVPAGPPASPTSQAAWKTMRAEHKVQLDVTLESGKHDRRQLRGIIAVERPDRFRLRAMGPAGITLFDLLDVAGEVKVLQSIKDPQASALGAIVQSLAGDLSAAYDLQPPPPGRATTVESDAITVREPDRTVRASKFVDVGGKAVPMHFEIENRAHHYSVAVDASGVELDQTLDPALWKE